MDNALTRDKADETENLQRDDTNMVGPAAIVWRARKVRSSVRRPTRDKWPECKTCKNKADFFVRFHDHISYWSSCKACLSAFVLESFDEIEAAETDDESVDLEALKRSVEKAKELLHSDDLDVGSGPG
jgi:hypothetical protein